MIECNKCIHYPVCDHSRDFFKYDECSYYSEESRPHGKWEYLKEHITDMRDADGKLNQKQTCQFILNLMRVIEKEGEENG